MPATLLRIEFLEVTALDQEMWGIAEWRLRATIAGAEVGDPQAIWEISKGDTLVVNWPVDYDVSGHSPEEDLTITFEATEVTRSFPSIARIPPPPLVPTVAKAIRDYQRATGLKVDRIVGPSTMEKLAGVP